MMNFKFKKVLAVALMTGFLTTSIGLGISEAASANYRPSYGSSHHQQMRPHVHKAGPVRHSSSHRGHGMYARGPVHHAPAHRGPGIYARGPVNRTPVMHRHRYPVSPSGYRGPVVIRQHKFPSHQHRDRTPGIYTRGPVNQAPGYRTPDIYTRGPVNQAPGYRTPGIYTRGPVNHTPVMHRHRHPVSPVGYRGPVVIRQHKFPSQQQRNRTMYGKGWTRASEPGGIIGEATENS